MGAFMSTHLQPTSELSKPATIGDLLSVEYKLKGEMQGLLWFIIIVFIIVIIMALYGYNVHKKMSQNK